MDDTTPTASAADVRAWARNNDLEVGSRGHLPQDVIDRFNRRHKRQFANSNPNPRREA